MSIHRERTVQLPPTAPADPSRSGDPDDLILGAFTSSAGLELDECDPDGATERMPCLSDPVDPDGITMSRRDRKKLELPGWSPEEETVALPPSPAPPGSIPGPRAGAMEPLSRAPSFEPLAEPDGAAGRRPLFDDGLIDPDGVTMSRLDRKKLELPGWSPEEETVELPPPPKPHAPQPQAAPSQQQAEARAQRSAVAPIEEPPPDPQPQTHQEPINLVHLVVNLAIGSVAVLLALGVVVAMIWGAPYYTTPRAARLDHPLHGLFKPGGPVGLWLGIIGATLMTAMLSYSVRKLLLPFEWLGAPMLWFRFHVVCGILGPIYIVLHSAWLLPEGYIATGFWCMILVALSGVFGRYVYGHFPRTAAGRSQGINDGEKSLMSLKEELVSQTRGSNAEALQEAVKLSQQPNVEVHSILSWFVLHVRTDLRANLVGFKLARSGLPPQVQRSAHEGLTAQLKARRNLAGWQVSAKLFRWWHLFHEPLAQAMYLIAALHILEAIIIGGALTHLWND